MSTLHELIYYCSEEDPMGAVFLTGEWGCGKTYLVETTLAKALSNSHMIVRVSLFGINSIDALNEAVHRQWLYVCTPFLGKLKQQREKLKKDSSFFAAVGNALRAVNPVAGGVASAMVAVDPIDLIPISPEADDLASGVRKKVVLVFDDLERSRLDSLEILGCINDYCENQDFNSIIIANEDYLLTAAHKDDLTIQVLKEKVIAHTVLYEPEYSEIVHAVLTERTWQSEPYTAFLLENEQRILEAFAGEPPADAEGLAKSHNIRSLIFALKQFFRVYVHLDQNHISYMEKYLYSFIVYSLVVKNGYFKDGKSCSDIQKEDLVRLYPDYSSDYMPDSVRKWVAYGVWDRSVFEEEVLGKRPET